MELIFGDIQVFVPPFTVLVVAAAVVFVAIGSVLKAWLVAEE